MQEQDFLSRMNQKVTIIVLRRAKICQYSALHSWRIWTNEARIVVMHFCVQLHKREGICSILACAIMKWRSSVSRAKRLECMMMLQENSCLYVLRLLAFYFDHWIIGKHTSIIESSITSRQDALRAGIRLLRKLASQRFCRLTFKGWARVAPRTRALAKEWMKLAVMMGNGSSISDAIAAEASAFLLKSRHKIQICDDMLDDTNSCMMYLSMNPMQNRAFLASEYSAIRGTLNQTRLRIEAMESKLEHFEEKLLS